MAEEKKPNKFITFIKKPVVYTIIIFALVFGLSFGYFKGTMMPVYVDGTSMNPTLNHKAYGLSDRFYYKLSGIKRFEIVTFHKKIEGVDELLVKRAIAFAGEHLEYKDGILKINDKVIEETFLSSEAKVATTVANGDIDLVIPEGHIFVMGDNRYGTNSYDSRMFGTIKQSKIESVGLLLIGRCKSISNGVCKGHRFSWPKRVK